MANTSSIGILFEMQVQNLAVSVYNKQKLLFYFSTKCILLIAKRENYYLKSQLSSILTLNFFEKTILGLIEILLYC